MNKEQITAIETALGFRLPESYTKVVLDYPESLKETEALTSVCSMTQTQSSMPILTFAKTDTSAKLGQNNTLLSAKTAAATIT